MWCAAMMGWYGLARVRAHGLAGLERDIGWGVLANDVRHLATAQAHRSQPTTQRAA